MINSSVLVLNKTFMPIDITTVKRAFCMLYTGIALAVGESFRTFDFESWRELKTEENNDTIGLIDSTIKIPWVIALVTYYRMPYNQIKLSRANIYIRDQNKCQYCGKVFPKSELTIDHIIPRAYGGLTTWKNIVCCCVSCNRKKGGQTPKSAGLKLLSKPKKPRWTPFFKLTYQEFKREEWKPFLNVIERAYWTVELIK
jgi:5-methylcytosine-specific restriction endonuclease McrA